MPAYSISQKPLIIAISLVFIAACTPIASPVGWSTAAPLPTARGELAAAAWGERIIVAGGLLGSVSASDAVEVYDVGSDSWQTLPPLPQATHHLAVAVVVDEVYVVGGSTEVVPFTPTKTLYLYDPAQNTWIRKADMPYGRYAHGAVGLNRKLYVIGGVGDVDSTSVLVYDPATDTWEVQAPMPAPREHLTVVALDGKIYAIAGRWNNSNMAILEVYDPATDTWASLAPMPTARSGLAAGAIKGLIYVIGGEDPISPIGIFAQNEVYDPMVNAWSTSADLPTPRHGVAAAVVGDRLYLIGGSSSPGALSVFGWSNAVEVYTPG